ncbi:MAG: RNA 2',3'-cyclic phosphodiesterase [Candidatus Bilamarchaeaceae archaeon]
MEEGTKRLFVAVELPQELRANIHEFARQIEQDGVKLVEEENLHITLRFIGEVPEETVSDIASRLEKIKFKEFECSIKGVGVFPSPSYIRVVWVGIECEQLMQLADSVIAALKGIGKEEERKFSAHLTIARVKKKIDLGEFLRKNKEKEFGKFNVSSFILFESKLTPKGPVYTELKRFS